jgi:hypothetical protein
MYVKIDSTENGYTVVHRDAGTYKDYSVEQRKGETAMQVAERAVALASALFMRQFQPEEVKSAT